MEPNRPIKVVELRNYRLKPRARDRFIDDFERHFIDSSMTKIFGRRINNIQNKRRKMKQQNKNQLVRANEIEWQSLASLDEADVRGIYVKSLMFDDETQRSPTILLKFEAGASYPLHTHPGGEEVFVLEGDIHLGKDHLHAGDYLFTAPDNFHAVRSDGGCVVFLKAPRATEFVKKRERADEE